MNLLKRIIAGAAACALACSIGAVGAFADTTDDWDELNQAEFTEALGLGWNLGNQLEASSNGTPNETVWGNPTITKELIETVKEQGFNTIRVPVSYLSKIGDGPDYTIDEDWLDRVQEVVDYCVESDVYVIINMHGDGYHTVTGGWLFCDASDEEQVEIKAKYESVWTQIAERFKDYDEHLIFESMNEEFNNDYGAPDADAYANINDYNQIFVDAVRSTGSNNAKRWLLIPGWNTNINYTVGDYGFEIPEDTLCEADENRIAISVHYYDPYGFVLNEAETSATQWGQYAEENYDSWGQEDYLEQQMASLYDTFVSEGYPVIIGEFGCIDKSARDEDNNEYRRYWVECVVKAAKENGCTPVYWDNGWNGKNGHAVIDRTTLEVTQQDIIDAMVRAISAEEDYEIPAVGSDLSALNDSSEAQTSTSQADTSSDESSDADSEVSSDSDNSSSASASSSSTASSSSSTTNPSTGVAAATFAIAAAAAAIVVTKKKNK